MKSLIIKKVDISWNIEKIREKVDTKIIAVVKSNGYGLGLCQLCSELIQSGISFFAITDIADALSIRENISPDVDILYMGAVYNFETAEKIIKNKIIATIYDVNSAEILSKAAFKIGKNVQAHVKINSGMNRYGFDNSAEIINILKLANVDYTGVYTHFASAMKREVVDEQMVRFNAILENIDYKFELTHVCNSFATLNYDDLHLDAVRVGSAILGRAAGNHNLRKVGFLHADINAINILKTGEKVGYHGSFKAKKELKTAIIDAGTYDGFNVVKNDDEFSAFEVLRTIYRKIRCLNKRIFVTINGKKCPVLGKISLNSAVIDVSNIGCEVGDSAEIVLNPLFVSVEIERKYV